MSRRAEMLIAARRQTGSTPAKRRNANRPRGPARVSGVFYCKMTAAFGLVVALWAIGGAWSADLDLPGQTKPAPTVETVAVRSLWSVDRARPGDTVTLAVVLDVVEGYHINADQAQIKPVANLKPVATSIYPLKADPAVTIASAIYPAARAVRFGFADAPLMVFEGRTVVHLPAAVDLQAAAGQAAIELEMVYQACDHQSCLMPQKTRLTAVLTIAEPGAAIRESQDPALALPVHQPQRAVDFDFFGWRLGLTPDAWPARVGLVLLAALGGLLLNFTPCVLPLIPIKILSLSRAASADPWRCVVLGMLTFLGVMAFWMTLGVMMAGISGFTATNQLFQYPAFTITVGVIIMVMALGMMGVFATKLPGFIYRFNPDQESALGAFGLGILTAVLSTPCTAPFMGAAAAWAAAQQPLIALMVFAAIGTGMGLPYLVLASRPGWIKSLPRTGPGSVLLKQVMGLLMLAAAAYFIGTGLSTVGMRAGGLPAKTYWWVVAGFGGGAGVWLGFKGLRVAPNRGWRLAVGLLAAVITVVSLATGVELTRREPIDWKVYTPSAFDQALAAGKIPVLVFTAEWCLNCKALEQSALHRQEAIEALQARDVVPLKVDLTAGNPAGKAKLQQVGRLAIPLAVIYDRAGKIVFLSDFYTAGQIRTAIDEARAAPRPTGAP